MSLVPLLNVSSKVGFFGVGEQFYWRGEQFWPDSFLAATNDSYGYQLTSASLSAILNH